MGDGKVSTVREEPGEEWGKGRMRRGGGNFWEEWGLEQGECRVKG